MTATLDHTPGQHAAADRAAEFLERVHALEVTAVRLAEERDAARAATAAETVRADAETVRANAAEDRVREFEALLGAERGHTAYWHARANEAEETLRCEAATLELPRLPAEPVRAKRRRRWRSR